MYNVIIWCMYTIEKVTRVMHPLSHVVFLFSFGHDIYALLISNSIMSALLSSIVLMIIAVLFHAFVTRYVFYN